MQRGRIFRDEADAMSEMTERVARAILVDNQNLGICHGPGPCMASPCCCTRNLYPLARAAIAAIREPTPEMLAAAWNVFNRYPRERLTAGPGFKEALQAMIDEALR
jgi:hypothetical protein